MKFSRVDKELSMYKGKRVVIWGVSLGGEEAFDVLKRKGIEVIGFTDSNSAKWGKRLRGLPIMSPEEVAGVYEQADNVMVQIGSSYEMQIQRRLKELGISDYAFHSELRLVEEFDIYQMFRNNTEFHQYYVKNIFAPTLPEEMWRKFLWQKGEKEECLILCMPPKVGNCTVYNTAMYRSCKDALVLNSWHTAKHIGEFVRITDMPVKIITAVREPIGQNLSFLYQSQIFWDKQMYWENDLEGMLNWLYEIEVNVVEDSCVYTEHIRRTKSTFLIQDYFERQFLEELGIDLYQYSFDKEKGCSVIKNGDMEILIYQLEKLNDVKDEVLEFIGVKPERGWIITNEVAEKYYASFYEETKREITFSKEYFDWSFNAPYLHHFYSEEDIWKMKEKWRSHIRE